jgi:type III pantothenate kinase
MKLILDIGNSLTKLAIVDANQIVFKTNVKEVNLKLIKENIASYTISKAIISDVKKMPVSFYQDIKENFNLQDWSYQKLPIQVDYKQAESLGQDRIAAAIAAADAFPKKNVLIVQCGSCICYDYLSSEGTYHGGAISPGIEMRFKALHTFTGNLPLLEKTPNLPEFIGKNTEESMLSGVLNGMIKEVDSMIEEFKQRIDSDLLVVLTGGHAIFFDKYLKNSNFAVSDFVLKGLNLILNFYVEENKNKHHSN